MRRLVAIQAQDYGGAKWALAQRSTSATNAGIDDALADGTILRTHVLRPTWHFVAPGDIRWLLELTAPRVEAILEQYYRKLGLDPAVRRRSNAALAKALDRDEQLTRAELTEVLRRRSIAVEDGRLGFLLLHAELSAVICSGGLRGKQFTYALLDRRAPRASTMTRDKSLVELVKRYFTTRGPATPQDFSWWSGLTVADARRGIEAAGRALVHERVGDATYWTSAKDMPSGSRVPTAQLLPNYDELLIAYRDRGAAIEPGLKTRFNPNDRLWMHIFLLKGYVVGGWRRDVEKGTAIARFHPRRPLRPSERTAIEAATKRYGTFVQMPVRIEWK